VSELIRNPLYIAAVLCLFVVLSEWLARNTSLRHLGTALLVILVTAVAANLGVIPAGSTEESPVPIYNTIFNYLAPLAIFWLLLPVNLHSVLRAGIPIIALFLIGAAGTTVGAVIGMAVVGGPDAIGPLGAAIGGMFVGTYIGGSINFNAIAIMHDVMREGVVFAGATAVDNVVTMVWMVATLALPRLLAPFWPRHAAGEPQAPRAEAITGVDDDTETVHPIHLAGLLALGLVSVLVSQGIEAATEAAGFEISYVITLTAIALLLAQFRFISQMPGTRLLGMFTVYLFLAVIGAFADVRSLGELGQLGITLLVFASILVLVHGTVTFGAARLLRLDLDVAAVASQANVGGGTSALAIARSLGRADLVLPAVLIGSLGNAVGTFIGAAVVVWLG
jgi:uncharacterized membrane protein